MTRTDALLLRLVPLEITDNNPICQNNFGFSDLNGDGTVQSSELVGPLDCG